MSHSEETLGKTRDTSEEICFSAAHGKPCTLLPYEIAEGTELGVSPQQTVAPAT